MTDADDIERLRDHWHELREAIGVTNLTVAVIQERQKGIGAQLDRIEAAVVDLPAQVAVLEARAEDAAANGAKWGAGLGAFTAAVVSGVAAFFGGPK